MTAPRSNVVWQALQEMNQQRTATPGDGGTSAADAAAAAAASAAAALASETAAAGSATAASGSASAASTQASNASASASTASTQASNASASASTASTQATAASGSASTASTQATAASGSASTASTQASNASASATAASASAASAAASAWTNVILGSDFTTSSATAVDVTGMNFTPVANTHYEVKAHLLTRTNTTTIGPRPGVAWPTGLTDGVVEIHQTSSATAEVQQRGNITAAVLAPVGGVPTTTGSWPAWVNAFFVAGAAPLGTFKLQLASETAGTTVTIKAGSVLSYRAIT